MIGRARHRPIRLAASSLRMLALFYLGIGGMEFLVDGMRNPSLRAFAAASVWLLPGVAFLLPAACMRPGRRRWPLAVGLLSTGAVTLGLVALLAWGVWQVGPWRLAGWRMPIQAEMALLVMLLIVYQSCGIHHLVRAWRAAADDAAAIGRGFAVRTPMPVRVIDVDETAGAASEQDTPAAAAERPAAGETA